MLRKLLAPILVVLLLLSFAEGAVVELNPSNFNSIVEDPKKNVFVMFYASWCGHCHHMMPVWEELSNKFGPGSSTVIARIEASTHTDIGSKYGVRGFPTIRLFPKNDKSGKIEFNGNRDLQDFENEKTNNYLCIAFRTCKKSSAPHVLVVRAQRVDDAYVPLLLLLLLLFLLLSGDGFLLEGLNFLFPVRGEMKRLHLCCVVFAVLLFFSAGVEAKVMQLNPRNYRMVMLNPRRSVLVLFHAPWAPDSRVAEEAIGVLANKWYNTTKEYFNVGSLDGSVHQEIIRAFPKVKDYPTAVLFTPENKRGDLLFHGDYQQKLMMTYEYSDIHLSLLSLHSIKTVVQASQA
eukprot:gene10854-7520_t